MKRVFQARGGEGRALRSVIRSMVLGLLLVVVAAMAANAVTTAVTDNRVDTVLHSLEPLNSANAAVLQSLTNAETGLRGWQLTGRSDFLQPYRSARAHWSKEMARAVRLAAGDERATALVVAERQAARSWLHGFAEPVASGRLSRRSEQADAEGKRLFDRLRQTNAAVARYVEGQARLADRAVANDTFVKVLILILTTLAILGAAGAMGLYLRRLIVPPLEALVATLQEMRTGRASRRADEEHGTLETRAVARAVNDLAEQNARLEAARARRERLRNLSISLSRRLREKLELEAVLTESVRDVGTSLGLERVVIRLAGPDGLLGPPAAHWHDPAIAGLSPELAGPATYTVDAIKVDRDTGRRAIISDDLDSDPLGEAELQAWFRRNGVAACVIYPLETDDSTLGILAVSETRPRAWADEELDILEAAADDLAQAIVHAQLYERERQVVAELQELDRAKTDFLSTVSHELRTPLTSINGYVELLVDGDAGPLNKEQDEMLGVVSRNIARLRGLIEDLLTLSRVESGTFRPSLARVDLAPALRNAAISAAPQAGGKGVSLHCDVDVSTGPLLVQADAVQLDRVVDNLLSNAVKFTPAGGEVRLEARRVGETIEVSVSDTGIGIPPADQAKLFGRFFRASNAVDQAIPGTGLGLSIVRAIVEQHDGSVRLLSEPGKGTTVTVVLPPLEAERSAPARPQEAKSSGLPSS